MINVELEIHPATLTEIKPLEKEQLNIPQKTMEEIKDLTKMVDSAHGIYLMIAGGILANLAIVLKINRVKETVNITTNEFFILIVSSLLLVGIGAYYLEKNQARKENVMNKALYPPKTGASK